MGGCGQEWRSVDVSLCGDLYCTTDGLSVCVSLSVHLCNYHSHIWGGEGKGGP